MQANDESASTQQALCGDKCGAKCIELNDQGDFGRPVVWSHIDAAQGEGGDSPLMIRLTHDRLPDPNKLPTHLRRTPVSKGRRPISR